MPNSIARRVKRRSAFLAAMAAATLVLLVILVEGRPLHGTRSDAGRPAAPHGLAAKATSHGISLDWGDNTESDLSYYAVRRSTQSNPRTGTWTRLAGDFNRSSALDADAGLVDGTTYYYYVTAIDTAGNVSARSAVVSASTPAQPSPKPASRSGLMANDDWSSGVASDYVVKFDMWGSSRTISHSIVSDVARHPGGRSMRIVAPDPTTSYDRLYMHMRAEDIPAKGPDERWYGMSYMLGDDWDLSRAQTATGGPYTFTHIMGFRFHDGGHYNGPGGWITFSPYAPIVKRAVTILPGVFAPNSGLTLGQFGKGQWVDGIAHINWSTGSDGYAEFWTKYASQTWAQATYSGRYHGYTIPHGGAAGTSYAWAGIYEGPGVDHQRTIWFGPWRMGHSRASVDPAVP